MNVSRFVSMLKEPHHAVLQVDLVPNISEAALAQWFDAGQGGKKGVHNVLQQILPRSMAECLLARAAITEPIVLAELPRRARLSLIEDLKRLAVPLSGTRGYAKAEVTSGGVATQEVNPAHHGKPLGTRSFFWQARFLMWMAQLAVSIFKPRSAQGI